MPGLSRQPCVAKSSQLRTHSRVCAGASAVTRRKRKSDTLFWETLKGTQRTRSRPVNSYCATALTRSLPSTRPLFVISTWYPLPLLNVAIAASNHFWLFDLLHGLSSFTLFRSPNGAMDTHNHPASMFLPCHGLFLKYSTTCSLPLVVKRPRNLVKATKETGPTHFFTNLSDSRGPDQRFNY